MSAQKSVFEDLRAAREAKGMTLEDISRSTLIDLKYLSAIENAQEKILPAAYIRAFIREYAAAIGLDPGEVIDAYDRASHSAAASVATQERQASAVAAVDLPPQPQRSWWHNRVRLLSAASAGIVSVLIFMVYVTRSLAPPTIREIPFAATVRENEVRTFTTDTAKLAPPTTISAHSDSLLLTATSSDSVWMQLSLDGAPPADYLFPPNVRRQWKARGKFTITLGNGGGIAFRLNTTDIGMLGKRGSVVRDVELTRRSLAPPAGGVTAP
jgi:cytoskeletal protein RodZ